MGAPADLAEVAEQLGVELDELYELQIPMGNDEFMTLGEIKDAAKGAHELKAERLKFTVERERQADELERSRGEVARMLQLVPKELMTGEVLAKVRREADAEMQREWTQLLRAVPEWKDTKRYATDFAEMAKVAESVGYSRRELEQVTDHRAYRLLLKLTRLTKAVDQALGDIKPREQRGGRRPAQRNNRGEKVAQTEARRRELAARGVDGKVQAIGELLKGA